MRKTVLVTGGSRGIGRACALQFAQDGYQVAVNFEKNEAAALKTVEEIGSQGGKAAAFGADISNGGEVGRMVRRVEARFGGIDVLINNAGVAQQKLFLDVTEAEWDRVFAVDVKGMFLCCKAVLPEMIAKKSGVILNLSSMWGQVGASCEVPYSAAKAAVIGLTKGLAKELGPSNIRVNCIAPGVIETDMNGALGEETLACLREETPLLRLGTPEDVARAALFLAGEGAKFITGQVLGINGGFVI